MSDQVYTPQDIDEILADASRFCSSDPESISSHLMRIIEQLRAGSTDRLGKLNAAVAEAEELRDERNALSLELRCAKDHLREVDAENARLREEICERAVCDICRQSGDNHA